MTQHTLATQAPIPAKRFTLRPLRRSDAGMIGHYAADKRLATGLKSVPHPLPPGWGAAFVDRVLRAPDKGCVWVLDGAETRLAEVLGLVGLDRMDRDQAQIGYWVAPAFWNAGFASEAVDALVAANPLGSLRIFAEAFQDNPVSARVLTQCGFDYLGDAEAYCLARGATVPTWTYSRCMRTGDG